MKLKIPFWSILLAILCYLPIAAFNLNIWYAIIPTLYLAFAFIVTTVYYIKITFFTNDSED
jgi:hypothetical protein